MPPPSLWNRGLQLLGRALRETGQAIDRLGIWGNSHAKSNYLRVGPDPIYLFNLHLSRHRNKMPLIRRGEPKIDRNASFIAPCSSLIGNVQIGERSSVWYGAVLRADSCNMGLGHDLSVQKEWKEQSLEERQFESQGLSSNSSGGCIEIGKGTNIQDGAIVTARVDHCLIGDGVTVGHMAQVHSSNIGSYSLIGMGSIIKPRSIVESFSFVAAGTVIEEGVTVPSGELWIGNPGRKCRNLTEDEKNKLIYQSKEYINVAASHEHVMVLGGNVPDDLDLKQQPKQIENNSGRMRSIS